MKKRTYISLFSSAGVGCFGLKKENFECIATNELLERRLKIQIINKKCKYDTGYISGDITLQETQNKILSEINYWKTNEALEYVDVLMATPPCQGMSTANYKKGKEINRNSLVVEAIHLVKQIEPRIFIFENVKAFLTTLCIDKDDETIQIDKCIKKHLEEDYNIYSKVVNFMDFGVPSSRPRTLVIGTKKSEHNFSPLNIFPLKKNKVTLKEAIGDLKSLEYGDKDITDPYHSFRIYPDYMQCWIHNLKEGETAFHNSKDNLPYRIVNGEKHVLKSGHMGNKFRRMFWNQPAPCITTRNDQLASQSTIHPKDDRVLSIRELMRVMNIPEDFMWVETINQKNVDSSETIIRQSIGEAVPTGIIIQIAKNINTMLDYDDFIKEHSKDNDYNAFKNCSNFYIKSYIFEKELSNSKETGSFYTPQIVVYNSIKSFKSNKEIMDILEPSVGVGAFIPQFLRLVDDCKKVNFDLLDISQDCLNLLKNLIEEQKIDKEKFTFNYICEDFVEFSSQHSYDSVISNPPYFKMNSEQKRKYEKFNDNKYENIFCLFLEKYTTLTDEIMCIIPKNFLMIPDCNPIREKLQRDFFVESIYDYGVGFFKEVFIEIISIKFTKRLIEKTHIENIHEKICKDIDKDYIYHDKFWIIYRDEWFDEFYKKIETNVFDFYRDRQISNKYLKSNKGKIWVIRSKNILDDGSIVHKEGYDRFVDDLDNFIIKKYLNKDCLLFVNFTYNTRATLLPKNSIVNGSVCILIPKSDTIKIDLNFYSSSEFRRYYAIVKNLSKFTINVDSNSICYIGVKKND